MFFTEIAVNRPVTLVDCNVTGEQFLERAKLAQRRGEAAILLPSAMMQTIHQTLGLQTGQLELAMLVHGTGRSATVALIATAANERYIGATLPAHALTTIEHALATYVTKDRLPMCEFDVVRQIQSGALCSSDMATNALPQGMRES